MQRVMWSRRGGWRSRGFVLACALALALLLTHQALIASACHLVVMESPHERIIPCSAMHARIMPHAGTDAPQVLLSECAAQRAVLPLLLFWLVLLAVLPCLLPALWHLPSPPWAHHLRFPRPPPLAPTQRRALLQVFRN